MRLPIRLRGTPPKHIDSHSVNGLSACAIGSQNCVSSVENDKSNLVEPLPFSGDLNATRLKLKGVMLQWPRTTLCKETDHYMWFTCESEMLGFVDDLEFYFDVGKKLINVRSASRLGRKDFNVNRKRVEAIRKKYLKTI